MSTIAYKEFSWRSAQAANGRTGEGLANAVAAHIARLKGVKRVCDLGCGNGYLAGLLDARGYDVTGVDASESGVAIARQHHPNASFLCAVIEPGIERKLGVGGFDLVVSSDVIEHLYRPADLIATAAALLGPQGHLILTTPYHGYLKNLALAITGRMDRHFCALEDGGHIKFFSRKTLATLVEAHDFRDLKFSYYGRVSGLWMNMIVHARKG